MATTTTTTSIDPDIKRELLPVLRDAGRMYRDGRLAAVADDSRVREMLLNNMDFAEELKLGMDPELMRNELLNTKGEMLANMDGARGSARGRAETQAGLNRVAMELDDKNREMMMRGLDLQTQSAISERELDQQIADKDAVALDRYFSLLKDAPQGDTTVQRGGGGK